MDKKVKSANPAYKNPFTPLRKTISKNRLDKKDRFQKGQKKTLNKKNRKVPKRFNPSYYKWVELPTPEGGPEAKFKARVMSFNILADSNIYSDLYPQVNPEHLKWEYRQPLLIKKIIELNPDIGCLQEFEPAISEDLVQALIAAKYKYEFKEKTGEKSEGCLTFWKDEMFEIMMHYHVDMNFSQRLPQLSFLDRDNIAQIVVLKSRTTEHSFIIANTHLIYNVKRGEVKLGINTFIENKLKLKGQALILLKSLNEVLALCDEVGLKLRSTFVCGDFNTIPNSLLYSVFSQSRFSFYNVPSAQMSNQIYAKCLNGADEVRHYTETTKKFSVYNDGQNKYTILDPKYIHILQKVKASISKHEGQLDFTYNSEAKDIKYINEFFSKTDFGVQDTFQSAYAHVNKEYYQKNPNDISTTLNRIIHNTKQKHPLFNLDRLTFENVASHTSSEFKVNVDYIWYKEFIFSFYYEVLELFNYDQLRNNTIIPNADHPSDHIPLVTDFYEQ